MCIAVTFGLNTILQAQQPVKTGTKAFTESVILGEMIRQSIEADGTDTEIYKQLGGTRILWSALVRGEIDIYPDYTGTITEEILADEDIRTTGELSAALNEYGIRMSEPLGFNNTYALGMKRSLARELGIQTISDLRDHPQLRFGFSNEFMDRNDGWPGLREAYNLSPARVDGLEHALAYRGLDEGSIDVIDLYSTDPEIEYYDLLVLSDDRSFFPDYEAVILYRIEVHDLVVNTIERLEGAISSDEMSSLNAAVKLDGVPDAVAASEFLEETFQIESDVAVSSFRDRLAKNTADHLYLVLISLSLAIAIAIPMGILAVKINILEGAVLGTVGVMQTIPSLALLVFMIPLFGIGALPAMAALFLYSLLPIVRNTHSGIKEIPLPILESARALGLPERVILRRIEIPLALPSILAGIKTSAVINVGVATLGALIGAGGYGQPILTGIRLDNIQLILEGAVPAAVLALLVQGVFDLIEKKIT
ncbi:amino acid ABC transporter permease [Rhodohalobacter mucosus]|uniref:Amino acid ABC transporter permease n=2 Tax=Rhodohalobacter mucosus TaxID=2079485 RepID=A0A316TVA2_9BACT|nr:amino acid ABC transporter permease [Rhodohalobacter mucosus]